MGLLISDVITEARQKCGDTDSSGYKWTDAQFLDALQDFFTVTGGSNAEALVDARGKIQAVPTGFALTDPWPWDAIYGHPAVHWCAGHFFESDEEDQRDQGLARKFLDEYDAFLAPVKGAEG